MNRMSAARSIVLSMAVLVVLVGMQGCGSIGISDPLKSDGRLTTTAAHALLPDKFEIIDLAAALDPEKHRIDKYKSDKDDIEAAIRAFYDHYPTSNVTDRRNRLQDRLFAASEQRCALYKHYLRRVEGVQATYTGITTTVLSGAGAIAQSVIGATTLSALAAISSGVGAELKQGLFANLTADVITAGIEARRKELRLEITQKRAQNPSITAYTMEESLEDIARYHGACGALAGLEKARDSIRDADAKPAPRAKESEAKARSTR